jgi:protein-S-isoprenylcysteine O-methyltransferase Ste14
MQAELGSGLTYLAYVCWGLFLVAWVLGAVYNVWRAPAEVDRGSRLSALPRWLLAPLAVLVFARLAPHVAWARSGFWNVDVAVLGAALLVASTLLALWARWTLGRMWSPVPSVRHQHELRTNGPYRITRHPIYTGILGMLLGSALMAGIGPVVVALIAFTVMFVYRIPREERLMTETFGEQYARYQREVPRLIPFVHV